MNDELIGIKATIAGVVAVLTSFWGWFGWLIVAWVILMFSDWLVGSAVACKRGDWSSAKLREGAWHKAGMIVIVAVSLGTDWMIGMMLSNIPAVNLPFTYSVLIAPMVVMWYSLGELGSLAEHGVSMGAPVPSWLTKVLKASKAAVDAAGDKLTEGGESDG